MHRSEVVSGLYSGGVKIPPLCVRADSMSPVQLCAKANLQKMLKVCVCDTQRLSRGMWPIQLMPEGLFEP